jgi:proline iminopeptidase
VAEPGEGHLPVEGSRLFYRVLGDGKPIVVLHGGPDFDHHYLVPELDRLADSFLLAYYDQRGRGRSDPVAPEEVGIESEMEDLDAVRRHFALDRVAVLGHSFGGLLALEYATRHPERVSHLILMNPAPASGEDARAFREHLRRLRQPADLERMSDIGASDHYRAGDLAAEGEYYRLHFKVALLRSDLVDVVVGRLRTHFTPEDVLRARTIEDRMYDQTWNTDGYDLVPKLGALDVPTLVLHGADDFVPVALSARIAETMPRAQLVVLEDCGHFAYLEAPDALHEHILALFENA